MTHSTAEDVADGAADGIAEDITGDIGDTGASDIIGRTGGSNSGGFPADALDAVEAAFGWLCSRPHPVTLDGRGIAGLPDTAVPLDEVRARLLDTATAPEVRDAVWSYLIRRARIDGPSATVAAAGMARPMLSGLARQLTGERFAGDPGDVRAEIVAGFLTGLRGGGVDPDRHPLVSLRWAAWRAGHAAVLDALDAPRPVDPHGLADADLPATGRPNGPRSSVASVASAVTDGDDTGGSLDDADGPGEPVGRRARHRESGPPPAPQGHPDVVLARAVRDGVLTADEAALIGTTRLEPVTVTEAAVALGTGAATLYARRSRAEARLVAHLTDPGPDPHDPTEHPSTRPTGHPSADSSAGSSGRRGDTGTTRRPGRRRRRGRPAGHRPTTPGAPEAATTPADPARPARPVGSAESGVTR